MRELTLPRLDDPLLSVVMVLYGGWEIACRAIAALAAHTEPCFELVLVDNASPDDTLQRVEERVEGATIIRNTRNRGFGGACNQGADQARGRTLCFLNSDALVEPGWLPPLLETLAEPGVGAVVPLYLNEDGSVQEAGSVVDSIGHCHAVGAGGDPRDFQLRFRREIDFGSAACMLVPAALFGELGGFDEAFAPAYFEDTDVCFRLHERGLRTIYEPRSRVVHVRHGSGTSERARQTMESHRGLFVERWGERLAQRPRVLEAAQKPHQMLAARDAEALDRFLVIDDRVPYTDRGSGDPRMARILEELAALWPAARTTLVAESGREAERYAEPLLRQGIEVVCPPTSWERWFVERRFHYGVVIVSRQQNAERFAGYLGLTQPQALRIFDTEALTFRRLERLAELLPPGEHYQQTRAEAVRTREAEIRAVHEADVVFVVSDEEAQFVSEIAPGKPAFVLPGVVETLADPPGFEERSGLLFFGGFLAGSASPNEDSLAYLVKEVLPLFWEEHPDVALDVIGADMSDSVRALEGPRVRIVGYVEDPAPWLSRARLHVNPMRFGAGLKQKFLDSLAAGLPFVTTSVGAEGFPLGDVRRLLVAEDAVGLARLMGRLYADRAEWERAHTHLLHLAETRFDRGSFQRTLLEAMTHVGVMPPARPALPAGPPAELVVRVVGTDDVGAFRRSGFEHVDRLAEILREVGRDLDEFSDIYDFGSGCGRLTQALRERAPRARLTATDIDEEAIEWLSRHMPDVDVRVNPWLPPLPFEDGAFDLVIAFSVFTHLPEDYQDAWLAELYRVTRPGGIVLATVHGAAHWRRTWDVHLEASPDRDELMQPLERALDEHGFAYWSGDGWESVFPDYYHTSWHRPDYVRAHWARWFDVLLLLEGGIGDHDVAVLRRPAPVAVSARPAPKVRR